MIKRYSKFLLTCLIISFLFLSIVTNVYASSGDPVYDSMTQPSESQSDFMKKIGRNYASITGNTSSPLSEKVLSIGSLYVTSGVTLPSTFTVYLGRMSLFAYSKSRGRWIILDKQPYPSGIYIYSLPWETSKSSKCKNITYTKDYAKIELTSSDLTNSVLHFWGHTVDIDKSDYLYYACAYNFWVDESAKGKLTATSGIDTKMRDGIHGVVQLYASRGLSSDTRIKTQWGHTVPVSDYYKYNTSSLNDLFKNGDIEPNLYINNTAPPKEYVDSKLQKTSITRLKPAKKSFRVYWKKYKNVDGYQIQYSTDKKLKSASKKIISKATTKSKVIKKLKSRTTYYVRVRTYKKYGKVKVYSKWSKKKKVIIN